MKFKQITPLIGGFDKQTILTECNFWFESITGKTTDSIDIKIDIDNSNTVECEVYTSFGAFKHSAKNGINVSIETDSKELESLVFLTFILGGFGNYSKMGFGSFSTEDVNIDNIYQHIQVLNPDFSIKSKYGVSWLENRFYKPNMIKSILLGRPQSGILKKIEDARYVTKKSNKHGLWLDSIESSINVSVVNERKPVIIVFYNKNACKQLQDDFCKYIL